MNKLVPGKPVPDFSAKLADGRLWRLSENAPDYMLMIDIYRGYHCPRCRGHLEAISAAAADFKKARMSVIAISVDSSERVAKSYQEWNIADITIGGELALEDADSLGLYLSHSIEIRPLESPIFTEPAVLFVRSDLTLYGAILQTFPFARPKIADLLEVPTFAAAKNYPPRGDYLLEVA
jgi:thiol-disulfide isomerase/thioredoxin